MDGSTQETSEPTNGVRLKTQEPLKRLFRFLVGFLFSVSVLIVVILMGSVLLQWRAHPNLADAFISAWSMMGYALSSSFVFWFLFSILMGFISLTQGIKKSLWIIALIDTGFTILIFLIIYFSFRLVWS